MVDGWSVVPPPSSQPQAPSIAAQDLPPPQGWSEPDLKRGYLKVTQAVDPSWLDATALTGDSVEGCDAVKTPTVRLVATRSGV